MKRATLLAGATLVGMGATLVTNHYLEAQPARGAPAAFQEVLRKINNSFKNMQLVGDPDRDFATMLIAHHEDLVFLAKTHLEYGGDRQLRQLSERILEDQQKQISELKEWQVRNRQPGYQAQPNQPPPSTGPLDQRTQAPAATSEHPAGHLAQTAPAVQASPGETRQNPTVTGTVKKIDSAAGKMTIDHGPIPNLNMDAMTMVFRVKDPSMLKQVKAGDKVSFEADRVNGQITVTKIQKSR